jgi:2-polyprenyl-3-methyl-5-hydroxy-6-metoxy-1,4-benzoquinol methylase
MNPPRQLRPLWDLGELPFHIGTREEPTNGGPPDLLPFALGVDEETGALAQLPRPEVSAALEEAYKEGSQIGTPLSPAGLGKPGLDEFLAFLTDAAGGSFEGVRVLEIGSGAGAVLDALSERGADVIGVEPDEQKAATSTVPVIPEPFTRELLGERRFDLITNYGVLEHVEEPRVFVADQLALLEPQGVMAFSVPNCRDYLAHGDISMLVHEHWSYFDPDSLAAQADAAGAEIVETRRGHAAGTQYSVWRPGGTGQMKPKDTAETFVERGRESVERLRAYLLETRERGLTLGVFAASRFFNYQQLLRDVCPPLRYFDDDPKHQGRYYPPFPIQVEPRASLVSRPVDRLLIMSWTFGDRLSAELSDEPALAGTEIATIADLLSPVAP